MATLTKGKTFTNGETVTPQKLHELVDLGTVSGIVNADIAAGADIADTKLATISTTGKVSNSATTATSANTASAIVARDASGNFSAGTITANLTGNASSATTAAACTGNAATATKLATARTITLGGDISGSVSFDGSANATLTAAVADDSHNHVISNIDGLQTALDGKQAAGSYAPATGIAPSAITGTAVITTDSRLSDARTPTSHNHDDRYYTETEMNALLAGKQAAGSYAAASHTHDASNITSGTISNARTTARNLRLADYVAANPLDPASYASQLLGKIAIHDSSTATIDTFGLNTFGVTSYSPGANSGVYSVNAVSKPGAALVQTYIGGILSNNTNTGVIYGTASDYRLKTNLEPLTGALARLAALPVHRFHWLGHTDSPKVDGFLAHEAQAIVPEAVTGTKDAVDAEGNPIHQGIDQSKLVPLLVAAVQELAARVAALEPAK